MPILGVILLMQCSSNLKYLALAMHDYASAYDNRHSDEFKSCVRQFEVVAAWTI
jgi:hypothetical protein